MRVPLLISAPAFQITSLDVSRFGDIVRVTIVLYVDRAMRDEMIEAAKVMYTDPVTGNDPSMSRFLTVNASLTTSTGETVLLHFRRAGGSGTENVASWDFKLAPDQLASEAFFVGAQDGSGIPVFATRVRPPLDE